LAVVTLLGSSSNHCAVSTDKELLPLALDPAAAAAAAVLRPKAEEKAYSGAV
jgi:predicted ATP-grasp superfamily ATP-dependent carboligase